MMHQGRVLLIDLIEIFIRANLVMIADFNHMAGIEVITSLAVQDHVLL